MSLIPKKGTVYVVDDDEAVRDSLQWLLEGKDYRVRCFDSAETFLSRYDPREIACLIVDIRMGGMTGLELQDRLIERKSPLPIVFITGHGDVPMAVNTMKKGALDFIQKPFNEEELLNLVERIDRKSTRLNSSHLLISYAVFCLKKKNKELSRSSGSRRGGRVRQLLAFPPEQLGGSRPPLRAAPPCADARLYRRGRALAAGVRTP